MKWLQIPVVAVCCLVGAGPLAFGQGTDSAKTIAPSEAINAQLRIIEGEMMSLVKAMPADKYDFAPSQAIFVAGQKAEFDTVRDFGQQATHVAQVNYSLFSTASGLKPDVDVAAIGKMTNKDEIVAALAGSFAFGHKAIATLTAENAFEVVKSPEAGTMTRGTLSTFAVAHAFDHYGQMVEYLRMNGIVPPASKR